VSLKAVLGAYEHGYPSGVLQIRKGSASDMELVWNTVWHFSCIVWTCSDIGNGTWRRESESWLDPGARKLPVRDATPARKFYRLEITHFLARDVETLMHSLLP
ncbi:MAG: hypothetical protein Q8Q12_02315, partial [bacterium]|nr:hypothetical protein [bacterium]